MINQIENYQDNNFDDVNISPDTSTLLNMTGENKWVEKYNSAIERKEVEKLSTHWSTAYEFLVDGENCWIEHILDSDIKASFANYQTTPLIYDEQSITQTGPTIWKEKWVAWYYMTNNDESQLCIICAWPLYEPDGTTTGLAFDNGKACGTWTELTELDKPQRWTWILVISGQKMYFSHRKEMTEQELETRKNKNADIFSVPSVKRNWDINRGGSDNLFDDDPNRYLTLNEDWTSSLLILGYTDEERKMLSDSKINDKKREEIKKDMIKRKIDIISANRYDRVLYLDSWSSSLNNTMVFDEDGKSTVYNKSSTGPLNQSTLWLKTPNTLIFYK